MAKVAREMVQNAGVDVDKYVDVAKYLETAREEDRHV